MAMSLNALKKLTKEELSNMVTGYQNKFDNILSNIKTDLLLEGIDLRKWNCSF